MRTGLFLLLVLFAAVWMSSCERENPVEKQEERIETYVKTKMNRNPEMKLSHENNVRYLYSPGNTAIDVSTGDSVYFYYAGTLLTDTLKYFDTNDKALAEALRLNTESRTFAPVGVIVGNNNLLPGLSIGLTMVHLGDNNGEIIFNSDMGYGEKGNGVVPPLSPLIFKIIIVRIRKN
jgi:FKBP-type peptidyl-prolyl cis-trans isomerase